MSISLHSEPKEVTRGVFIEYKGAEAAADICAVELCANEKEL
jgi:hypothetical protein